MTSHRAFPPGRGNLKIPTSSRRAAHAGLALYAPCRPKGRVARWGAWRLVDLFGARAVPGKATVWQPPMSQADWGVLVEEWSRIVGSFDEVAVHERAQVSRSGFAALLLSNGEPVGFVKVRDDDMEPLQNEFQALDAMWSFRPSFFEVPQPVAVGSVVSWHYLLTSAFRPDLHRMALEPPLRRIIIEIRSGLEAIVRPDGTPAHWEPMHGDFTPWNLRQRRDGSRFLVDWEDAGWAPPGADDVYYQAVRMVLGNRDNGEGLTGRPEARAFWRRLLLDRVAGTSTDSDRGLSVSLLRILGRGGDADSTPGHPK